MCVVAKNKLVIYGNIKGFFFAFSDLFYSTSVVSDAVFTKKIIFVL